MSKKKRLGKISSEVFAVRDSLVSIGPAEIDFLKKEVRHTERKRIRLCAHRDIEDPLHEMMILLSRDTYIRPHKHVNKLESLHLVEGEADAVFFDEDGGIREVIAMGGYQSGSTFYYRINDPCYHTLVITSEYIVFHEATTGPFRKSDTIYAAWAPEEGDRPASTAYMEELQRAARRFRDRSRGDAEISIT